MMDAIHPRSRRALPSPGDESLEGFFGALDLCGYPTIGSVSDGAMEPEGDRALLGRISKAHALDAAEDVETYAPLHVRSGLDDNRPAQCRVEEV